MEPFNYLCFDLETNGLLDELTTIHSLVIEHPLTGEVWSLYGSAIPEGLERLRTADGIIGHNIIGFDIPAIQKLYPEWVPQGVVRDTLIASRLFWPSEQIRDRDFKRAEKAGFPKNLIGRYTLEAFGYRMGNYKGDFKGPWTTWTEEMQAYCEQDVHVTVDLYRRCLDTAKEWGLDFWSDAPSPGLDAIDLEHRVATIIARQERHGVCFDVAAAGKLYAELLARHQDISGQLTRAFPPKIVTTYFTPKRDNRARGYVAGRTIKRELTVPFNPSSRQQVADRLKELGWEPSEFTETGLPKIDDETLKHLDLPQARLLADYFMLEKRMGQLADGKQALIRAEKNGRIYGRVITNGAVTGRMTHQQPNMAQVPSSRQEYGERFRALFVAPPGYMLVGCDADALELRCLAAYLARYDGGEYIRTVLSGNKAEGTDMHTLNAAALGCDRDTAKTWFYAFIYGAGDWKLGSILSDERGPRAKTAQVGRAARERFLRALPAMAKLVKAIRVTVEGLKNKQGQIIRPGRPYLIGLDGRRISVRSPHAALNSLLQSAGAILMKRALVLLDAALRASKAEFAFVLNIHDEWQL